MEEGEEAGDGRTEGSPAIGGGGQAVIMPNVDGEGNGNPLQYACLENPMDGGAW